MTRGGFKRFGVTLLTAVMTFGTPCMSMIANAEECTGSECVVEARQMVSGTESEELIGAGDYTLQTKNSITFKDIRGKNSVTAALADGTCKMYVLSSISTCGSCNYLARTLTPELDNGEFCNLKIIFLESRADVTSYVSKYSDKIIFANSRQDSSVQSLNWELQDIACDIYYQQSGIKNRYGTPTTVIVDGNGKVLDARAGGFNSVDDIKKITANCGSCVQPSDNTNNNTTGNNTTGNNTNSTPSNNTNTNSNITNNTKPNYTPSNFADVPANEYYAAPVSWALSKGITNGTGANTFSPNAKCTRAQVVTFLWRANGSPEPRGTSPFADVSNPNDYYYKAVVWAAEKSITTGKTATRFAPNDTVTRAEFVTFLHRAKGSPLVFGRNPFQDISFGKYYYIPVIWAYAKNITTGKSKTQFAPTAACTRAEVVTFIYRAYAQ